VSGDRPASTTGAPDDAPIEAVVAQEAREAIRAPWAAGIAGIAFAVLFTAALLVIRALPVPAPTDSAVAGWYADGWDDELLLSSLYLIPFAGVAFLWFLAVVRDHFGSHEDRFVGTVFLGSGLLFVALLFSVAGVAGSLVVGVRYLGQAPPTADILDAVRAIGYTLLFAVASRAAALFIAATATIGRRSGIFPRWFAFVGYAVALTLLVVVTFWDGIVLVLPIWVTAVSLLILVREHGRRGAAPATASGRTGDV